MPRKRPQIPRGALRGPTQSVARGPDGISETPTTSPGSLIAKARLPLVPESAGNGPDDTARVPDDRSSPVRSTGIADYISGKVNAKGCAIGVAGKWSELNVGSFGGTEKLAIR
jgi:hypothetical protein